MLAYNVFPTKKFQKSYQRIKRSGKLRVDAEKDLEKAIKILAQKETLPVQYRDHQLKGDLEDLRECHIKGDLLLVYQIREKELILLLVDIGSHSYLNL